MTQLARLLKRGDLFDPECGRTTHRLRVARGLLREQGIEPVIEHFTQCAKHSDNLGVGMSYNGCWDGCRTVWPSWVTDQIFEHAAEAASAIQNMKRVIGSVQMSAVKAAS